VKNNVSKEYNASVCRFEEQVKEETKPEEGSKQNEA
jgi:hypothetical protein